MDCMGRGVRVLWREEWELMAECEVECAELVDVRFYSRSAGGSWVGSACLVGL